VPELDWLEKEFGLSLAAESDGREDEAGKCWERSAREVCAKSGQSVRILATVGLVPSIAFFANSILSRRGKAKEPTRFHWSRLPI
jgi:hypothetical protein